MSTITDIQSKIDNIQSQIDKIRADDEQVNKLMHGINEGGDGYYQSSGDKLDALYYQLWRAKDALFAAQWPADLTASRRIDFNARSKAAGVKNIVELIKFNTIFKKQNGWGSEELKKAININGL